MNIAYRFRIYPTEEQKILLGKTFGCCRFLYNQMLDDKSSFIWKRHIYHCECGNKMDRDHNAAINIREEARSPPPLQNEGTEKVDYTVYIWYNVSIKYRRCFYDRTTAEIDAKSIHGNI